MKRLLKGFASLPRRLGSGGSSFLAKPSRLLHAGVALALAAGLIWTYAGSSEIEAPAAVTTAPDAPAPATTAAVVPTEQQSTPSATEAATKTEPASAVAPAQASNSKSADAQPVGAKRAETKPTEAPAVAEPAPTKHVAAPPSFQDTRPIAQPAPAQPTAAPAPSTPAAVAPGAMFRDARPLQLPATQTEAPAPAIPPKPETSLTFRDTRPITNSPMFQDRRPVEIPSFQDKRPVALPSFQVPPVTALPPATEPAAPTAAAPSTPVANTTDVTKPSLVAVAPPPLKIDAGACRAPEITTEALDGGMMALHITAACHPNETVQISYAGAEFLRKLNAWGALDFTLDCFAGTSSVVDVRFGDNTRKTIPVVARDLDKVSKIAVLWRAPVNLDLHVFEYAARHGQAGHLWAKKPSAIATARLASQTEKRGHGFLSAIDDDQSLGDKIEVYTFLHNDEQASGSIALALDYETRGETPAGATCGQGALAEIDFQVVIQPRGGQVTRQAGVLTRVECGIRIATESRFNQAALPGLRIRR